MSNLINFNFENHPVRVELKDGEPLFCLTDVAVILNLGNANPSRFNLDEAGVHKMYISYPSGKKEVTFISEPNLYRVIFRSNKKEAVKFQNWVFNEVLPSIRKTGSYEVAPKTALSTMDITTLPRPTGIYPTKRFLAEVDKYGQMKMRELSDLEFVSTFASLPTIIRHCAYAYQGNNEQMAAIAKAALNTITREYD